MWNRNSGDSISDETFMSLEPELTVAAVVEREGRFLMVEEHAHGQIVFNQPSGRLEPGETLEQALVREVLEETGRGFSLLELIGIYRWRHPETGRQLLRVAFSGRCGAREPGRRLDEVILRTHWMSRNEIAGRSEMLRSPMVLRCIDDYLDGVRLSPGALAPLHRLREDLEAVTRLAAAL